MASSKTKTRSHTTDPTQTLLQKNDRVREKHLRELSRLGCEAQRVNGDLSKQIDELQREIRDIHAYTIVYKDNSLVRIDEKRHKPTYTDVVEAESPSKKEGDGVADPSAITTVKKHASKPTSAKGSRDPFRLKSCLADVEMSIKESGNLTVVAKPGKQMSVRKQLARSNTASATRRGGSSEYQSLLPGNCTSYYSIRKFYEQEKDKLIRHWSPEEKRKRTVQTILTRNTNPQYSLSRNSTTLSVDDLVVKRSNSVSTDSPSLPGITGNIHRLDSMGSAKLNNDKGA